MGNVRSTVISGSAHQDQWFGKADGRDVADKTTNTDSRVFPVASVATWQCADETEQLIEPPAQELSETGEHQFWDTPPRDSLTDLPSLAPPPVRLAPSPWRIWAARLLFAMIFCATVVLLGLEIKALAAQDGAPSIAAGAAAKQLILRP